MYKVVVIVIAAVIAGNTYVEVSLLWESPYYWQLLWWFPTVAAIVSIIISRISHVVTGRYFAKGVLLAVEIPKVFFCYMFYDGHSALVIDTRDLSCHECNRCPTWPILIHGRIVRVAIWMETAKSCEGFIGI